MASDRDEVPILNANDINRELLSRLCAAASLRTNLLQQTDVQLDRWDRQYGATSMVSTEFFDFTVDDLVNQGPDQTVRVYLYCREVYSSIKDAIEKLTKEALTQRLLIVGNRSAGKSFLLLYLLLCRIVENCPTIYVKRKNHSRQLEAYYVKDHRVRLMHEGLGDWVNSRETCVALYDGNGPLTRLVMDNCSVVVQTSRPFADYNQLCDYAFFINDWTWKEVYCVAYTTGLPPRQLTRANWLFHRFGRGIDMLLKFNDFSDDRLARTCEEMDNYLCRDINCLLRGTSLAEVARNSFHFPIPTVVFKTNASLVSAKDLDEHGLAEITSFRFGSQYILKRTVQTYFILQRQRTLLNPWNRYSCKEERTEVIRTMQKVIFANGGCFGVASGNRFSVLTLNPSSVLLQSISQLTEYLSGGDYRKYLNRVMLFDPSYELCAESPIGIVLRGRSWSRNSSLWLIVFSSVNAKTYLYREELQGIWHALPESYCRKRPTLALAAVYESGTEGRLPLETKITSRPFLTARDTSKVGAKWPYPAFTRSVIPLKLDELLGR
ncbi:hypothetical protein TRVA0_019S00496 [Trichomonascus vanleenenianus]|uniref:uncharacterized protein n=1 Tax=Trichomonascus vanleenenianus TaxID=2268995 RepID=UPI003EC9F2ED